MVAHPDDEALWFSSIVGRVSRVIIAYEACADLPELGAARRAARAGFPLANANFLRLAEPCSLNGVDWQRPQASAFGIELNLPGAAAAAARYRAAYAALRGELDVALAGVTQVFTHNPWGEYGHPDHVQVARVVQSLEPDLGFRTRFSSYIAPRSMAFAAQFLGRMRQESQFEPDRELAARIKAHYTAHGAWTWHADYQPPPSEAFLAMASSPPTEAQTLPLVCLMTT